MLFRLIIIFIIYVIVSITSESISNLLDSIINPPYTVIIINFLLIISISLYVYHWKNNKILAFNSWIKKRVDKLVNDSILDINNSDEWEDIVELIEATHHTSIISKIKNLESEDKISLPVFKSKFDFNHKFLHKIREFIILFESILEKMKHRSFYEENNKENIGKYQKIIEQKLYNTYILKYKYKLYLQFYNFIYSLLPFIVAISLSILYFYKSDNGDINDMSYLYFFSGISLLSLLYPLLNIIDSVINFFIIKKNMKPNIIIKSFYIIFTSFVLTLVTFYGVYLLTSTNECFSHLFQFFKSTVFEQNIENLDVILNMEKLVNIQNNLGSYLFFIKLTILLTMTSIVYYVLNFYIEGYDQFYYEQKIKKYLLPPDLLKIVSMVILTIASIAYLYINLSSPPKLSKHSQVSIYNIKDTSTPLTIKQKEEKSMENLLPFSIFLALLGTLLAVSTRDIMENYFTGLSLKVNSPYEEGDRVKIGDYGILEVKEIGTRSDDFYEIETNSIISIPHKKLAQIDIKNYTKPTLDYREEISIYIPDQNLKKGNIPRESEKLLLLSAFINTGVKIPKIENCLIQEVKKILKYYQAYDTEKEYSELEQDNKFTRIINKTWIKLKGFNSKENKLFENLFISTLPFNLIHEGVKSSKKHKEETNFLIKKSILAIINSVIEYQESIPILNIHADKNGIRRKYKIFQQLTDNQLDDFATSLVNISFYYYMLSNRLWELKEQQSLIQKRKIDKAMIEILSVPKITSEQYVNNATLYWKVTLLVTLELSEEGKETIHHINMYVDELWDRLLIFQNNESISKKNHGIQENKSKV